MKTFFDINTAVYVYHLSQFDQIDKTVCIQLHNLDSGIPLFNLDSGVPLFNLDSGVPVFLLQVFKDLITKTYGFQLCYSLFINNIGQGY